MSTTTGKEKKAARPVAKPDQGAAAHQALLSPMIQSAVAIEAWGKYAGALDLQGMVDGLGDRVAEVHGGDMRRVESMLYSQAKVLETIFVSLARRAANQEYMKQFQTHLTLALKAQAQCRATLEALAEIKNPRPVAFVKQANISGGHQQVNNGTQQVASAVSTESGSVRAGAPARAEEILSAPNELFAARLASGT